MIKVIENKKNLSSKFLDFFIRDIKTAMYYLTDLNKLIVFEKYLNDNLNKIDKSTHLKYIYLLPIIKQAIKNLKYKIIDNKIYFYIDNNIKVTNTNIKICDIFDFIDHGNIEIVGYGIYSKILDDYIKNIDIFVLKYIEKIDGEYLEISSSIK